MNSPNAQQLQCEIDIQQDQETSMALVIKAEVRNTQAKTFTFGAQKTMYGGKHIAEGDTVFIFASENEGGRGLIARGIVSFHHFLQLDTPFSEVFRALNSVCQ
jgi:hypothetical protein